MNDADFTKMIMIIAFGLKEKESYGKRYTYSNQLMHGINIFAALAINYANTDILKDMNEADFIEKYASKPIEQWFEGWEDDFRNSICKYPLLHTKELIRLNDNNQFRITDECMDLLDTADDDLIKGIEQHEVYQKMSELSEQDYVMLRKFIIEHPICSQSDIRNVKLDNIQNRNIGEVLEAAYEKLPEDSYICPVCGWTMTFNGMQAYCCNHSCTCRKINKNDLKHIDPDGMYRLKHGVMRYISIPGRLELDIQKCAENLKFNTELWPEKDRYDIKIYISSDKFYAIDAKTYSRPYVLAGNIINDTYFDSINSDDLYYVVPDEVLSEYPDYCQICNEALKRNNMKSKCITFKQLKKKLREEQL